MCYVDSTPLDLLLSSQSFPRWTSSTSHNFQNFIWKSWHRDLFRQEYTVSADERYCRRLFCLIHYLTPLFSNLNCNAKTQILTPHTSKYIEKSKSLVSQDASHKLRAFQEASARWAPFPLHIPRTSVMSTMSPLPYLHIFAIHQSNLIIYVEIRLKIWNFTFFPRTVPVIWKSETSECITPSIPPQLHVNHEARREGFRFYTKHPITNLTSNSSSSSSVTLLNRGKIYFNYDRDTALISIANYGHTFLNNLKVIEPHMQEHYRYVKAISIDEFTLDLTPGIVLRVGPDPLPLLEEFEITHCHAELLTKDQMEEAKKLKICNTRKPGDGVRLIGSKSESGSMRKMPILRCASNDYYCEHHWWFKAWNDCTERRVSSWSRYYIWAKGQIYSRWGRDWKDGRRMLGPFATVTLLGTGVPLDLAEIPDAELMWRIRGYLTIFIQHSKVTQVCAIE